MGKQYKVRVKKLNSDGSGQVVFNNRKFDIKRVLPGELVTMELVYRANVTGAKLCEVLEASDDRVEPLCKNFGNCGGCQLLHMNETTQKAFKQQVCEELLGGYGKVLPILTDPNPVNYRNKVHAAFAYSKTKPRRIVSGIYEEETHRVVPTEECLLVDRRAAEYLKTVRKLMEQTKTAPYEEDFGRGVLRYVFLRFAKATNQVLMVLVTGTEDFPARNRFASEIQKKHPEIVTLIHNVNPARNSMVLGKKETVLYGKGTIEDELCGCKFRISDVSFYQVNSEQTRVLYETAVSMAGLNENSVVLDAYCGIGTIGMIASKTAGKVMGVELNKKAVADAIMNAKLNNRKNIEFYCSDAGEFMVAASKSEQRPDIVFMDPPRAGSDEKFLKALLVASPKKIVYISCNPETLARDLKTLAQGGYKVQRIQPVDMFPKTVHVETICLLSKKNAKNFVEIGVDAEDYYRIKEK